MVSYTNVSVSKCNLIIPILPFIMRTFAATLTLFHGLVAAISRVSPRGNTYVRKFDPREHGLLLMQRNRNLDSGRNVPVA